MTSVNDTIDPEDGPTTEVGIRSSTVETAAGFPGRQAEVRAQALFDTGAQTTLIQVGFAEVLGIMSHDRTEIMTLAGPTLCNLFSVDLLFPDTTIEVLDLLVAEVDFQSYTETDVKVIIGRSVLQKGVFHYEGWEGIFSFRLGA